MAPTSLEILDLDSRSFVSATLVVRNPPEDEEDEEEDEESDDKEDEDDENHGNDDGYSE
jgi:hypothetical protein